ncbi:MAG: DUF5010 domain-containing protein [Planctomycetes bacterium]|nr:DUF5010 domain-containing protein [Planctomycetota bacterium]
MTRDSFPGTFGVILTLGLGAAVSPAFGQLEGPFAAPATPAIRTAVSNSLNTPVVATHYFYWYREPGEHMEQLGLHFPEGQRVGYDLQAWHRAEMEDVVAAGIDVVLPVYWGAVDHYDKPDVAFSVRGLPPLVAALDAMSEEKGTAPKVGMFYDTSTWLAHVRGERSRENARLDLRTEEGLDVLYRTVRDFFRQVPPRHWACLHGQPLVVFYASAFASGYDQATFDRLRERFASDFAGVEPYVVLDATFAGVDSQARCRWGAALNGPFVEGRVAQIGAGYDDRAVRGRTTPVREREDGRFYARNWQRVLEVRPELVLIETWNEHHEGTSIARTREYGRFYIEETAKYVRMLRAGERSSEAIELEHEFPRPCLDTSWGTESIGADRLRYDATSGEHGVRPVVWEDGPYRTETVEGVEVLVTAEHPFGDTQFLYFQIADVCWNDLKDGAIELHVTYFDDVEGSIAVEYDSRDREATLRGAYRRTESRARAGRSTWREERWTLPHARFANRQNGLADLRLVSPGRPLRVRSVLLERK